MAGSINQDEYIKALMALGLTGLQARSYFTLIELGTSTVGQLAIASKTDRPDIYRATFELLQLGLVEKAISNPVKYTPLPFVDTVRILSRRKSKENAGLIASLDKLIKGLEGKRKDITYIADDSQFALIPEGEALRLKLLKMAETSQKNICLVDQFEKTFAMAQQKAIMKALERGVNLKVITEKPFGISVSKEIIRHQKRHSFDIRYLNIYPPVCFGIYDRKDAFLHFLQAKVMSNHQLFGQITLP